MNVMRVLAHWLLVLSVPLLIISATIGVAFNSLWIYTSGFAKYDVATEIGLSDAELKRAARELIAYLNSPNRMLLDINVTYDNGQSGPLYDRGAVEHMKDVKGLLWLNYSICLATTVCVLLQVIVFWLKKRAMLAWELAKSAWHGGLVTCGLLVCMALLAVTGFDSFFTKFHEIFFPYGNWIFYYDNHMVIMFPIGFWVDVVLLVGMAGMVLGATVAGLGWWGLRYLRRREQALVRDECV